MVTLERLTLGTAPDSWGVWFPSDPRQVDWQQYLDEIAQAGYVWTELGPSGFLPQDPAQLRDELDAHGLQLCGGTIFAGLHRGADDAVEACSQSSSPCSGSLPSARNRPSMMSLSAFWDCGDSRAARTSIDCTLSFRRTMAAFKAAPSTSAGSSS